MIIEKKQQSQYRWETSKKDAICTGCYKEVVAHWTHVLIDPDRGVVVGCNRCTKIKYESQSNKKISSEKASEITQTPDVQNQNLIPLNEESTSSVQKEDDSNMSSTVPALPLVSINRDASLSYFQNVMSATKAGIELGAAGAVSGAATEFIIKRIASAYPVVGAFLQSTPFARPVLDVAVPVVMGYVAWNKWIPGVSADRQQKIADYCLLATASHVDTVMSALGRDFFASLIKHMENAVAEWQENPLGK
jgi:hypothetical protein